jgi:hypothetical protein
MGQARGYDINLYAAGKKTCFIIISSSTFVSQICYQPSDGFENLTSYTPTEIFPQKVPTSPEV